MVGLFEFLTKFEIRVELQTSQHTWKDIITELQKIADYINQSTTGSVATIMKNHVSVQVPGIEYTGGQKPKKFYSTENVRTMRSAVRLIQSMEM